MVNTDYSNRAQRLRDRLRRDDLPPAMLISDPANVRWLTGLASSNAVAVLLGEAVVVVTDSRYSEQARGTGADVHVRIDRDLFAAAVSATTDAAMTSMTVEADALTVTEMARIAALADHVIVVESCGVVADLRIAKDASEVDALTRACEISTSALAKLASSVIPGMTEIVIARQLEQIFGELGADDRAFPTIVAAGPNSAVPHHEPTMREIAVGDILKVDFGARVDGYHADCTRTFVVGADPTVRNLEVHAAVAAAASAARDALCVGIEVAALDEIARDVLRAARLEQYFTHGLGHGVGLRIHEAPLLAKASAGTITDGSVVTIEPGVYLPGEFGVRIEDTCHVTADSVTILTDFPRDLARIA